MKHKNVDVTVYGFKNIGTEEKCREVIDVLMRNGLVPLKYGTSERPKNVFNIEDFVKLWTDMEKKKGFGIPFIRGDDFYVSISWGGAKPYYTFLNIAAKKFSDWKSVIEFSKDLFSWNESCYGYIGLDGVVDRLYAPGLNIIDCLGGITWANFFGKPYVDMWGEEKLLKAPTWKTERLKDGGYLLITDESPTAIGRDDAEKKLREYLGEKYFYKKPLINKSETITREELYEKVFGDHEPEPTGYMAPDFSNYYDL